MCSSNCRKGKSLYNFDFWKPNRAGQCRGKGREKVQKEINKHKQIDADGGHWVRSNFEFLNFTLNDKGINLYL